MFFYFSVPNLRKNVWRLASIISYLASHLNYFHLNIFGTLFICKNADNHVKDLPSYLSLFPAWELFLQLFFLFPYLFSFDIFFNVLLFYLLYFILIFLISFISVLSTFTLLSSCHFHVLYVFLSASTTCCTLSISILYL